MVRKDRSLAGLVDAGFDDLEPLLDFREWLIQLREVDKNRMPVRRDGTTKHRADGSVVRGPFTMKVRRKILKQLQSLEQEMGRELLIKPEMEMIEDIWRRDEVHYETRDALMRSVGAVAVG